MGKIKLNLASGTIIEKPLICAFKANNMDYIVLDNELNGSMGLPIILVCKLENNKVTKIADQNEWQIVKEYLKNIIAGNQINFIKIPASLMADDIYYTQLTLPIPSFDALKKSYNIEESTSATSNETTIMDINTNTLNAPTSAPISPNPAVSAPTPNINPTPSAPIMDNPAPINPAPQIDPFSPVGTTPVMPQTPSNVTPQPSEPIAPVSEPALVTPSPTPEVNMNLNAPVVDIAMPSSPMPQTPPVVENPTNVIANPNVGVEQVTPGLVNNQSVSNGTSIFQEQKESFLQACENMFDALVQKFEKELENKK